MRNEELGIFRAARAKIRLLKLCRVVRKITDEASSASKREQRLNLFKLCRAGSKSRTQSVACKPSANKFT